MIGLPEAVHQVVSKGASLVIHRGSTVPTVEVVLQLKLSAFSCRTDEAIVSYRLNNATLTHSFTHQIDAIKRGPSVHPPAEAKASSKHHHGCLCGTSVFGMFKQKTREIFTGYSDPLSQSIGRGQISWEGALDVRESRERRDTVFAKK